MIELVDLTDLVRRLMAGIEQCEDNGLLDHLGAGDAEWEDEFFKAMAEARAFLLARSAGKR